MKDPTLTILQLVSGDWDKTNTSIDYVPEIHTGWHDTEANAPQVTVTARDEGPVRTGQTPFTGFVPDGSGPTQELTGSIMVNCWSSWEVESNANPKKLTYEFSEEVIRIVKAHTHDATDLRYIGYGGRRFSPDASAEPVVFRYAVTVNYGYQQRP